MIWCYLLQTLYVKILVLPFHGVTFYLGPDIVCYNSDVVFQDIIYVIIVIWCYLSRYYICYNSDMVLPLQILYML